MRYAAGGLYTTAVMHVPSFAIVGIYSVVSHRLGQKTEGRDAGESLGQAMC